MGSLTLFLGLFCISIIASHCEAKGSIKIKLMFYKNPDGKDQQGKCCDRSIGLFCKADGCDHTFNVCIDKKGGYGCTFGKIQTPAVIDKNAIEFTDSIGSMPNPLVFHVNGPIPNAIDIKVGVYDEDLGFNARNTYVDLIKVPVASLTTEPHTVSVTHRTTIDLRVWYECDAEVAQFTPKLLPKRNDSYGGEGCKDKTSKRELWLRDFLDKYYH